MTNWKKILPKSPGDWFATLFIIVMIHVICLFELLVILPEIYSDGYTTGYYAHVIFGVCLYFNVMCSYVYTVVTDTTSGSIVLPSVLKPGWRFCSACEANAPPRSFHCWVCNTCILRRDHHCIFTGNCVGLANHRHYVMFLVYLAIGALYCNYLNMDYTWELLGGFSFTAVFTMIVPMVAWAFGLTGTYTFTVAFISSSCLLGGLLLITMVVYNVINIANGQTGFERSHRVHEYNCGRRENIKQVFGEKWRIAWISSFIESKLPSDGVDFPRRTAFENVKDM